MSVVRAVFVGALLCIPVARAAVAQADTTPAQPDTTNEDVITLKGDRVLRGKIVDSGRAGFLVVRTRDGKDLVLAWDQIVRVERATPPAPLRPPPVTQHVATVDSDTTNEDVIYLKGDRVLRGRIVDSERAGFLVLRARDGKDMVVARDQIVRVVRGTRPAIPTPPPVPQRVTTVDRHGTVIETTVTAETPVLRTVNRKEPGLSWLLSFLIPGAGQYYNGQWEKGVAFMSIQIVTAAMYWSKREECQFTAADCTTQNIAIAVMFVNWIATQVDAPISASAINRSNGTALEVGPQPHSLGISVARVRF